MKLSFAVFTGLLFAFVFSGCKKKQNEYNPFFNQYIDSYTSGVISKTGSIKIKFNPTLSITHALGETKEKYFSFSPSVKGKTIWLDANTIEFQPEKNLDPDKLYDVTFNLAKITDVPKEFSDFKFHFQTIKPSFEVRNYGLRSSGSKDKMFLDGKIETADFEDDTKVEKFLQATLAGQPLKISWQHISGTKSHLFKIENILRTNKEEVLKLSWDGSSVKIETKGSKEFKVPAVGDFKVLNIVAMSETDQYTSVQFSDPVLIGQELTGLITMNGQENISYSINGSEVKLYSDQNLEGNYIINVNPGIKNTFGNTLEKGFTANVFFENRFPSVQIQGRGNILPNTGKLILPFESINLKAVDVTILKIYENNIPQFFQTNNLAGESELRRVAKPIVQKTIMLDSDKTLDLTKRQRFSIDLDKILKAEQGAIYRIIIGFRPEYSLYNCDNKKSAEEINEPNYSYNSSIDEDDNFWNRYDDYYYYGYNWEERDNPCDRSYYNKDRWASRNIIASNLGLTAKIGNDNTIRVAVTNIITTDPIAGVELEMLDYQNQIIQKSSTDKDGFAIFEMKRKPFLLIAKNKNEKGYLKLDEGSSLPLSRFDISGEEIKKGIKGFVFGERGVYRPGDSLFIQCIIENKETKLPEGFPVEMELYNPLGQIFRRMVQPNAPGGFNVFKTSTDESSPTGNWRVKIKAGGASFEKRIKVETVMPNRLKVDLSFGTDSIIGVSNQAGILESKWLFGTPAKNLKATVDASLYSKNSPFPKFKDFSFTSPVSNYSTQSKTVFDGLLNNEGKAVFKPEFGAGSNYPGLMQANMVVKVFEPGGAFSINSLNFPFSPYSSYVGIKVPQGNNFWGFLETGKSHSAEIVDVNAKGFLIGGNKTVEVQFYKIQWRWWWDDSGDNISNFTQDKYNKLISKQTIELNNGKGSYNFKVGENEWGRFLILVKDLSSGHTSGQIVYLDQPGWETRSLASDPSAAAMLSFTSDKPKYNIGDEIKLTIPSSEGGRILVSLENGSHVLKSFWVASAAGQTVVKFKAGKEMSPNIYATVSLIQPHSQSINDLPVRMYGTIPVFIEDKNSYLHPEISMPSVIRPEQQTSLTVSEKSGREMYYSIAIVDDGLLDLTNFKTPDPHSYFYSREALGVKTWDLYDMIIGAWGANIERILSIGGDNEGSGAPKPKKANRFKPVVKYMGPFKLNKGVKANHSFILPQYIGRVRAMVVAAADNAYGSTEKSIEVKKPLMILGTAPRVLGPGEIVRIPVSVFALDNKIKNVNLEIKSNKLIEVLGSNKQSMAFENQGEQLAYFDLKIKSETGIAKIKISAVAGNEKADYDVELDIRNPNPPVTNVVSRNLNAGEKWNDVAKAIGSASTATAILELSSIPAINLEKRLDFLINYPHGCIEQITSGAFPQLYLSALTKLSDRRDALVQKNVKGVIASIQNYQTSDGGFSYWPGQNSSDEWGTNYAGHFLLEAQQKGFNVSSELLQQWKSFQGTKARNWAPSTNNFYGSDLTQAYRLYLLALAKAPDLGAMNRLKAFKYLSPQAKWRLAAAYVLVEQKQVASQLVAGLPLTFKTDKNINYTYGSDLRDEAMVLETLTLMDRRKEGENLLNSIAAQLSGDNWYSTQTTAYSLLAISKYCSASTSKPKIEAKALLNGKSVDINTNEFIYQSEINITSGTSNFSVSNSGNGVLFARLITNGQPISGEELHVTENPSVLKLSVSYINKEMKPIDVSKLVQGTDFIAKVTIANPGFRGDYDRMALTQIFPSGWEIINTRMQEGEGAFKSSSFDYQDIRDDRVYTYFGLAPSQTNTYYIQLNASYLGKFFMPGTYATEMYDNTISAGINGKWIEVVKE